MTIAQPRLCPGNISTTFTKDQKNGYIKPCSHIPLNSADRDNVSTAAKCKISKFKQLFLG